MTYGDGFAALVGKSLKSKEYQVFGSRKTIAGSAVMFWMSFLITIAVFSYSNTQMWALKAIGISVIATVLEAVSVKGKDNLTVPIITSFITYFVI